MRVQGEATDRDLAAMLRRWCTPYPSGECCMCQQPPEEDHDEECRVPGLMLIANRLDELATLQAYLAATQSEFDKLLTALATHGTARISLTRTPRRHQEAR